MAQEQGTWESREECVARMLRNGTSWSTIEEECGVSRSTISRIKNRIEGGDKGAAGSVLWDAELNAKAIELIRKGKARTPADLVEHLKIPIPQATELFNATTTAMGMTASNIVELLRKLDKMRNEVRQLIRELDKKIDKAESVELQLDVMVSKASKISEELGEKIEKALEIMLKSAKDRLAGAST